MVMKFKIILNKDPSKSSVWIDGKLCQDITEVEIFQDMGNFPKIQLTFLAEEIDIEYD